MNHYLDLKLVETAEFPTTVLMSAVFQKFHLALVRIGTGKIGVSFPRAAKTLGDVLRLHGPREALQQFAQDGWLGGAGACVRIAEVLPVPAVCQYRLVRRVQVKSSRARLLRRSVRKGWLTEAEAESRLALALEVRVNCPFVELRSSSTGQSFRLFIEHGVTTDAQVEGAFSSYGLSEEATVPWF